MRLFFDTFLEQQGAEFASHGYYGTMTGALGNASESRFEETAADVQLTRRVAAGDEAAIRTLLLQITPRVKATCRYLAGDADAEDMTQLALMQVVASAGQFRGESTLGYWTDRITVRTAAKQFEKRSRRRALREAIWQPGPESVDLERQAAQKQLQHRLSLHFGKLSEKQRSAVVLHYLHGYAVPEIADLLGIRFNAVRSRLRKGLKQLRQHILTDPYLTEWVPEERS